MPRGSDPIITQTTDDWMKQTVLDSTPADFGYDTNLWTCPILASLLLDKFGVDVSDTAVRQHLKAMGLTCQKSEYQDVQRDEGEIAHFLDDKFPRIQRLAEKMGGRHRV
jgi:transposase